MIAAISLTGAQSSLATKIMTEMGDEMKRAAVFAEALALKKNTLDKGVPSLRVLLGACPFPTRRSEGGSQRPPLHAHN